MCTFLCHLPFVFVYVYIVKLPHRSMTFWYLYSINNMSTVCLIGSVRDTWMYVHCMLGWFYTWHLDVCPLYAWLVLYVTLWMYVHCMRGWFCTWHLDVCPLYAWLVLYVTLGCMSTVCLVGSVRDTWMYVHCMLGWFCTWHLDACPLYAWLVLYVTLGCIYNVYGVGSMRAYVGACVHARV